MALLTLMAINSTELGNKKANIFFKKNSSSTMLTEKDQKLQKI